MIYLNLFFSFFKIGLFSFGGGYAMIPLIQKEIEANGWIKTSDFVDIIAISEMTPGPIAINTATFVGYKAAGLLGSLVATIGVSLPSFVLILIVSSFFFKIQKTPVNTMVLYGVRPVIAGLIAAAAFFVAETVIFKKDLSIEVFNYVFDKPASFFDFRGIAILVVSLFALVKLEMHPILVIAGAGVAGAIIYSFVPSVL